MLRRWVVITLPLFLFVFVVPVHAHANLMRSEPVANAQISTAPDEIRLYFTEPIESQFSRIELRNTLGDIMAMPHAQVDADDDKQLFIVSDTLPDGIYTVAWRVVSQTDGHLTQGTFPITIGAATGVAQSLSSLADESIPVTSAIIRWLNLLSLAWLVGSVGFWLFIWHPAVPEGHPAIEQHMKHVIGLGWLAVGIASALMLLLQTSIVSGISLWNSFTDIPLVLMGTRFGQLWIVRGILWLSFGGLLFAFQKRTHWLYRLLLLLGCGILITQSLFSHASGAVDAVPAVIADWLHLLAMAIWIGGLIQFAVVIRGVRQLLRVLAVMVAHFSNMARLAVAMLVITGLYAAWLQIGSMDDFISTQYGQAMTLKLILFLPLLALGAVNLILTSRGLQAGKIIWSRRLQTLVTAEITLTIAILIAVGVMTAIAPARITSASRDAVSSAPPSNTFFEMAFDGDLMIHLTIEPGFVGENTFNVELYDASTNELIEDASLIRLRFEPENANVGESELRPTLQTYGSYSVTGSNLSIADDWRVRMTIQRPNKFDTVVDFEPTIIVPQTPAIVAFDPAPPQRSRAFALVLTGFAGIFVAGVALVRTRPLRLNPQTILTIVFLAGSIVILQSGLQLLTPTTVAAATASIKDDSPVQMAVTASVDHPYLLTKNGVLLRPVDDRWQGVDFDEAINAIYLPDSLTMWAATDSGLFQYVDAAWQTVSDKPAAVLVSTHGYLFALGAGEIFRIGEGGIETDRRILEIPQPAEPSTQFAMLGNHSHVLLNGDAVYLTSSLGLGWQPLNAPVPIRHIAIDTDGHLLATSDNELWRWRWTEQTWQVFSQLPTATLNDIVVFNNRIYIAASGQVYKRQNGDWQIIEFDADTYVTDIAFQYPDTLWALDNGTSRLWWVQAESEDWTAIPIVSTGASQ